MPTTANKPAPLTIAVLWIRDILYGSGSADPCLLPQWIGSGSLPLTKNPGSIPLTKDPDPDTAYYYFFKFLRAFSSYGYRKTN